MANQLEPIGREVVSLAEEAYQRISNAMLTGVFAPGTRLVMDQLAEQLDTSRTPVRDALLRLERERLIEPSGRRGYIVSAITTQDVNWIYEAREAIEGFAARRVAQIGAEAVAVFKSALDEADSAKSMEPRAAFNANLHVHRTLVEAAGNPMLVSLFDEIWQRARGMATFADYVEHAQLHRSVKEEHLPLLAALDVGPDAALDALREHIRAGQHSHLG
jgi:DNA-binding GntR family transcriptional regulator